MTGGTALLSAPWSVPIDRSEYLLIVYVLSIAGFAFLAAFIRSCLSPREVGSRYRTVVVARLAITAVSFLSYVGLLVAFATGYTRHGGFFVPNDGAVLTMAIRYVEWSVAVPLLTVEILAVCAVAGAAARRFGILAFGASFAMIFCGFVGAVLEGELPDRMATVVWGLVACVFWVATTILLVRAVRASRALLTPESMGLLKRANAILLGGFVVYPVVYLIPLLFSGGTWTTVVQLSFTVADVAVKILFGDLLLRVAKLRTAEDVRAGEDVHPESIWISSVKQSDAGRPREVYLAAGSIAHTPRGPGAHGTAVATETAEPWRDTDLDPEAESGAFRGPTPTP